VSRRPGPGEVRQFVEHYGVGLALCALIVVIGATLLVVIG
jgi:hypothetical protein